MIMLSSLFEQIVDHSRGFGIERAGRLVSAEHEGLFGELAGKDDPLLLTSREVAGDVHHAVREPHLVEQVCGPRYRFFARISDIIQGMHDVFNDAVVTIKRERALEHDRGAPHDLSLQLFIILGPEVHIERFHLCAAFGTFCAGFTLNFDVGTFITGSDMVDDFAAGRSLVNSPDKVHQHGLSGTAPPDYTEQFAFGE
jgi:hypothetical protein